jgi:hypothetical protein
MSELDFYTAGDLRVKLHYRTTASVRAWADRHGVAYRRTAGSRGRLLFDGGDVRRALGKVAAPKGKRRVVNPWVAAGHAALGEG